MEEQQPTIVVCQVMKDWQHIVSKIPKDFDKPSQREIALEIILALIETGYYTMPLPC